MPPARVSNCLGGATADRLPGTNETHEWNVQRRHEILPLPLAVACTAKMFMQSSIQSRRIGEQDFGA